MSEVHKELECRSSDPDNVYSIKHLKSKFETKYGDDLFFSDLDGRSNVLCFKPNASRIINDAWYRSRNESFCPSASNETVLVLTFTLLFRKNTECIFVNYKKQRDIIGKYRYDILLSSNCIISVCAK